MSTENHCSSNSFMSWKRPYRKNQAIFAIEVIKEILSVSLANGRCCLVLIK